GLLIGKRALKKRIKSAVLDIGVQKSIKGSRIYALLKGVVDAGLKVPHSPDVLPPEDRIKGEHIVKYAKELKEGNKERYRIQFSRTNPEELPRMFEEVKSKIVG
ncbi:MAG: 50S ribosomal protein L18, partial [Candidatus Asgardarchaeia archaeon]